MIPIEFFLMLSAILFVIGLYGVLTKSNGILVLMCIELMLNAANINFIAFSAFNPDVTEAVLGQIFVILAIAVAAAEVGVGIAILLKAYRAKKTTDVDELISMRW